VVVAAALTEPVSLALRVANVPIVIGLFKMAAWAVVFAVASAGPDIAVSVAGVVEAALAVSVVLVPTLISEVSMPTVRVMFVAVMAGGKQGWTMDADRGDAASPNTSKQNLLPSPQQFPISSWHS